MWRATILTLFPEMFPGLLSHSLSGKALAAGVWGMEAADIRASATDRHGTVDDTPFGGGPGMVMRPDVVDRAIRAAQGPGPLLVMSPRGKVFDQDLAAKLAAGPGLRILCGRYEGIDQRVVEAHGAREVSIGDYVLSGGEAAAMVVVDSCVRLLPGVMGNTATSDEESFVSGLREYPHYTRPALWRNDDGVERAVPAVLLSGHHEKIRQWRLDQARSVTEERRPDLWHRYVEQSPEVSYNGPTFGKS